MKSSLLFDWLVEEMNAHFLGALVKVIVEKGDLRRNPLFGHEMDFSSDVLDSLWAFWLYKSSSKDVLNLSKKKVKEFEVALEQECAREDLLEGSSIIQAFESAFDESKIRHLVLALQFDTLSSGKENCWDRSMKSCVLSAFSVVNVEHENCPSWLVGSKVETNQECDVLQQATAIELSEMFDFLNRFCPESIRHLFSEAAFGDFGIDLMIWDFKEEGRSIFLEGVWKEGMIAPPPFLQKEEITC